MRFIGLDVHRDFCEVALVQDGRLRSVGQIMTAPAELEVFAQSLARDDVVAMEATANALAIARVIEPHVQRVVLADPKAVKGMTGLRAKTDKIDAQLLARLLAAGFLAEVWTPDEPTRVRRRLISRRMHLVRHRVREKNQVHAVLQRQLKRRPPMSDVFGVKGRVWLSDQCRLLPIDEQQTVDACLRQIDFLKDRQAGPRQRGHSPADDVARGQRCHRHSDDGRDRRCQPIPDRRSPRRLSRAQPKSAPVRQRASKARPNQ